VYVFKTMSDAFAGRISYFKVFSGVLKNDASLQNYNRNTLEKFAHISLIQGKHGGSDSGDSCGRYRSGREAAGDAHGRHAGR
jgi:translation elongation factor EF-G